MKILILTILTITLLLTSCRDSATNTNSSETASKTPSELYKKEPLPIDFSYKIVEEKTNNSLEKNELTVEINKKISIGQIATLAEEFYLSKPKQRRFYIFYLLPGMKIGSGAWATSHYNPELRIEITGGTIEQDIEKNKLTDQVEGEIVGRWHLQSYASANYVISQKDGEVFLRIIFYNGQTLDEEMKPKKVKTGTRYDYKEESNGEYFISNNNGELEFYNKENKKFATASKMN